jgi:hypothetical protein
VIERDPSWRLGKGGQVHPRQVACSFGAFKAPDRVVAGDLSVFADCPAEQVERSAQAGEAVAAIGERDISSVSHGVIPVAPLGTVANSPMQAARSPTPYGSPRPRYHFGAPVM